MDSNTNQENMLAISEQNQNYELEIPQAKIDLVAGLSDSEKKWLKLTEGGFILSKDDKFVPEIIGVICGLNPYFIKWSDDKKSNDKIPMEHPSQEPPENYSLRCDLTIEVDGSLYGLSLAKTSTKHHLAPYISQLKKNGFAPDQVVTRIKSKSVATQAGKFNIAIFEPISKIGEQQPVKAAKAVVNVTPRPQSPAAANPWA